MPDAVLVGEAVRGLKLGGMPLIRAVQALLFQGDRGGRALDQRFRLQADPSRETQA